MSLIVWLSVGLGVWAARSLSSPHVSAQSHFTDWTFYYQWVSRSASTAGRHQGAPAVQLHNQWWGSSEQLQGRLPQGQSEDVVDARLCQILARKTRATISTFAKTPSRPSGAGLHEATISCRVRAEGQQWIDIINVQMEKKLRRARGCGCGSGGGGLWVRWTASTAVPRRLGGKTL